MMERFQELVSNFLLEPLEAALIYRELGLSVVPIKAGTKRMATELCHGDYGPYDVNYEDWD